MAIYARRYSIVQRRLESLTFLKLEELRPYLPWLGEQNLAPRFSLLPHLSYWLLHSDYCCAISSHQIELYPSLSIKVSVSFFNLEFVVALCWLRRYLALEIIMLQLQK